MDQQSRRKHLPSSHRQEQQLHAAASVPSPAHPILHGQQHMMPVSAMQSFGMQEAATSTTTTCLVSHQRRMTLRLLTSIVHLALGMCCCIREDDDDDDFKRSDVMLRYGAQ
jgi:hypothetical protein